MEKKGEGVRKKPSETAQKHVFLHKSFNGKSCGNRGKKGFSCTRKEKERKRKKGKKGKKGKDNEKTLKESERK